MKTTLNIDDTVMAQLKREALRQKRTMSDLVETALRNLLRRQEAQSEVPPLPTFMSGGSFVDVGRPGRSLSGYGRAMTAWSLSTRTSLSTPRTRILNGT